MGKPFANMIFGISIVTLQDNLFLVIKYFLFIIKIEENVLAGKRFDASTKQASIHFGILSDGITAIGQAQDIHHAETDANLRTILANQEHARIIGTERFEAIDTNLRSIGEQLEKEGIKSDKILHVLRVEREKNMRRFQSIINAFQGQKDQLDLISDGQNATLFYLRQVLTNIEIKSEIASNSFNDLRMNALMIGKQASDSHAMTLNILNDIRKRLAETSTPNTNMIILYLKEYSEKTSQLDLLLEDASSFLKTKGKFSLDKLLDNCRKFMPHNYLRFLNEHIGPLRTSGLSHSVVSTLKLYSDDSIFGHRLMSASYLKNAEKSLLLQQTCMSVEDVPPAEFDHYVNSSIDRLRLYKRSLLESEYSLPIDLIKRLSSKLDSLIDLSGDISSYALADRIFKNLVLNFNWNQWTVVVSDHINVFSSLTKSGDLNMLVGGSVVLSKMSSQNMKTLLVAWKPFATAPVGSTVKMSSEAWDCIYARTRNILLRLLASDTTLTVNLLTGIASEEARSVLSQFSLQFCTIVTVLHESIVDGKKATSNMAAETNMKLDSRVFVIELDARNNLTLEVLVDTNKCEQGRIVKTNIDRKSFGSSAFDFLIRMPQTELALSKPDKAIHVINERLASYFSTLWSVTVISRAEETDSKVEYDFGAAKYLHMSN